MADYLYPTGLPAQPTGLAGKLGWQLIGNIPRVFTKANIIESEVPGFYHRNAVGGAPRGVLPIPQGFLGYILWQVEDPVGTFTPVGLEWVGPYTYELTGASGIPASGSSLATSEEAAEVWVTKLGDYKLISAYLKQGDGDLPEPELWTEPEFELRDLSTMEPLLVAVATLEITAELAVKASYAIDGLNDIQEAKDYGFIFRLLDPDGKQHTFPESGVGVLVVEK